MLEEWILQLRKDEQHYNVDSWKYRIAGNVLELSVLQSCIKDKQFYRISIITIGQVLRAISCNIEETNSHFLIQSLPELENPEIIASIRMDLNSFHTESFPPCDIGKKNLPILSRLNMISELYHFRLINTEKPANQRNPEHQTNNLKNWFALTSKFDNPFTWLNVGYWKETILRSCRSDSDLKSDLYLDFCSTNPKERLNHILPDNQKLQALIAIDENHLNYSIKPVRF